MSTMPKPPEQVRLHWTKPEARMGVPPERTVVRRRTREPAAAPKRRLWPLAIACVVAIGAAFGGGWAVRRAADKPGNGAAAALPIRIAGPSAPALRGLSAARPLPGLTRVRKRKPSPTPAPVTAPVTAPVVVAPSFSAPSPPRQVAARPRPQPHPGLVPGKRIRK